MRKALAYFFIIIIIIFAIPIIFTKKSEIKEKVIQEENSIKENEYDYKKYETIKLLHTKTNEIEEVKLDEYIVNVVCAEMPADFEKEALKAQAIVARTYTIYKIETNQRKHDEADICDDSKCCQAWISKEDRLNKWEEDLRESNWKKIQDAVNETKGKIITYEGKPINAFFHSNSGGTTEIPVNVWGGNDYPYLQVVQTSGEEQYSQYNSEAILKKEEFVNKIKEKYPKLEIDFKDNECVKIMERTESGRVKTLKIGNIEISGVEARTILGLRSANFNIEISENTIKFTVIGYGHGVGMSQTGADALAKEGKNYEEIIKHFYVGVEISEL